MPSPEFTPGINCFMPQLIPSLIFALSISLLSLVASFESSGVLPAKSKIYVI